MKIEPGPLHSFPDGKPEADQPKWRKDFPLDVEADEYGARRDFTKFMVLTSLAFVCGQFWIGIQSLFGKPKTHPQEIAHVDQLEVGQSIQFHYPTERDSCLLMRQSNDTFLAFSNQCTHLMCPVRPDLANNRLHCPCHEGFFDATTGRPQAGPPRRPLPKIKLKIEDGIIYAIDVELRTS